jgi:glycosyltransferase involved in cell wall biosynthesis
VKFTEGNSKVHRACPVKPCLLCFTGVAPEDVTGAYLTGPMNSNNSTSAKTRLMIITHDLAIGGLQQVVVNLCKSINRDTFDVSVLCLRALGEFVPEVEQLGIKVFFLPQKNRTDYFSFLKVAKILRKEKIDVIHTHNTQPLIDGTIGALLSGRKIRIVHTDHARNFPDKKRYMFAEWLMSHFAYKVVGVSDHTSQNLIKYEKINPKKIVTIPNGIDGEKFNISIDREAKRKELGIKNRRPIIGLGVRLTEQKGVTYLLQAMPKVVKEFPDITLIIAGDGPLLESLKKETLNLRLDKNIYFVGPRLDMPELLKLFDLYVLPSLWEGLPMVLLEAMAAECPIVATNVGGNGTVIKHKENGSLIEAKNPEKLALEIIKLLSKKDLRIRYSNNSFKLFLKKFTADIMTRKYELLYLRTI